MVLEHMYSSRQRSYAGVQPGLSDTLCHRPCRYLMRRYCTSRGVNAKYINCPSSPSTFLFLLLLSGKIPSCERALASFRTPLSGHFHPFRLWEAVRCRIIALMRLELLCANSHFMPVECFFHGMCPLLPPVR